jgi:hypothetical protein
MPLPSTVSSRARLAGLCLAAVIVAACGSSATPAPSVAAGAVASSAPSAASVPSAAPASQAAASEAPASAAPSTAPVASPASGDAAAALANLTSYKFRIAITSTNATSGLGSLGDISMEGTAVLKPTPAADVVMKMGASGGSMDFRMIQVGDKSWMNLGDSWTETTDPSQSNLLDSLSPEKLFGSSVGSFASGMTAVGDETKNGIACTHMRAGAEALAGMNAVMASSFGVAGTWVVEYWVAKEGGYLVSAMMKGTGTNEGKPSETSISIDLRDLDNPANVVNAPV